MNKPTICVLAFAVVAGCGRGGSQGPEAPSPENQETADVQTGGGTYVPSEADKHVARVGDMLLGRVPGLEVMRLSNGDYTLRIRGPHTFSGNGVNEEPLLVLDGSPVPPGSISGALSALNPRDIQRVDVLRDASQTALYGLRGANGVVVITTTRPR